MKNLKKVLALALAFAMAFSMFASAAFTDQATISADHADDVAMLVELGVLGGYPDGSFKPQNTITRAEFTKMAYTIKYGYDDSGKLFAGSVSKFTDVEGVSAVAWAKGYINYCANQGIIGGVGNNKFNPNGNVTVAEAAKMLLVILGCDASKEGYGGSNWMGNVVSDAMELGVFDGWVGDPTAPATRELVATLMANTIFANTYVYSPITGVGSQNNPLDPSVKNETLGAKTMGLEFAEGIIVANDTWYIEKDAEGKLIGNKNDEGVVAASVVDGVAEKGFFTLAYEDLVDGKLVWDTVDFEVALGSDYLGAKASVYYTVKDGETNIIGDVVVSADTVMYEVTTDMLEIMPKEDEDASARKILPYISIDVGDKEYQIKSRVKDVAREEWAGNKYYTGTQLANYFYFPAVDDQGDYATAGKLDNDTSVTEAFYTDLKLDGIQSYRVVSLDGGKTISYIFRNTTKALGEVDTYKPELDNVKVDGVSVIDIEENLVVDGEIAKGDDVVYWQDGEKLFVCATEEVVGKATVLDDNEVTIGENTYRSDIKIFNKETGNSDERGIAYYYGTKANINSDSARYVAYNGYLLALENKGANADISEYAVVLQSYFDGDEGMAKVRLGFADETAGTYYVNRVDGSKVNKNIENVNFKPAGWEGDKFVGVIFRYTLNSDGTVNLYTDDTTIFATAADEIPSGDEFKKIGIDADGKFSYEADEAALNFVDDGVVFMLYGGGAHNATEGEYDRVNVAVFKTSEIEKEFTASQMYNYTDGAKTNIYRRSYVMDATGKGNKIILAAFPFGTKKPALSAGNGAPIAYVLDKMSLVKDEETGEYYANAKLLTADGIVETRTVNNITDIVGHSSKIGYGSILEVNGSETGDLSGTLTKGTIITCAYDDEGLISNITLMATPSTMKSATTGWMYATISNVTDSRINYYNWSASDIDTETEYDKEQNKKTPLKYDVEVWALDESLEFVEDGEIETISEGETIPAEEYNAIINIAGAYIEQVISFYGRI